MVSLNLSFGVLLLIFLFLVWSFIWKGLALWKCGRNKQNIWFIIILVVNTLGILEILYLLFFQKDNNYKKFRR